MSAPSHFALALFTFLYVDIIDCTATLYSMARFSGVVDAKSGDFPRSTVAYCTDSLCISIGALFGTSPVTAFIESGAGIAEGGKTGLTAITTGVCFLISLFFAPIFASIPPWATGCTLVIVSSRQSLLVELHELTQIGWMYDDAPSYSHQLAVHWRRRTRICHPFVHAIQLLGCVRLDCVSHFAFKPLDMTNICQWHSLLHHHQRSYILNSFTLFWLLDSNR